MKILDDGLDELAARTYQGLPLRVLVTIGAAAVVSLLLPWRLCAAWLALQAVSEGTSVFFTRPQALGRTVGPAMRLGQLLNLMYGALLWMGLGAALWFLDVPGGPTCAVIIWLAVIFFGQNNAYQSTTGFVVGGAIPGPGHAGLRDRRPEPAPPAAGPVGRAAGPGALLRRPTASSAACRRAGGWRSAQREMAASEAQYRLLADNVTDVIAPDRRRRRAPLCLAVDRAGAGLSRPRSCWRRPTSPICIPTTARRCVEAVASLTRDGRRAHHASTA